MLANIKSCAIIVVDFEAFLTNPLVPSELGAAYYFDG